MGNTASKYTVIRVSPTLDTGAYADDDVFFNSTAIPNAVLGNGGCSKLIGISILNEDDVAHDIDIVFMQKSTDLANALNVAVGTGSKWTNALAKAAGVLGVVSVDWSTGTSDFVNVAFTATGTGYVDASTQLTLDAVDDGADSSDVSEAQWTALYPTDGSSLFDGVLENLILVAPDYDAATNIQTLQAYADYRGTDFVVCAGESDDSTVANATAFKLALTATSTRTAMYWPWLKAYDELTQSVKLMTPVGHVAGCYARTDKNETIGKAPAGITDGQLYGITDINKHLLLPDRDTLYQAKINPLVADDTLGMVIWGARTTSLEFQWRYVNARRLFMYVEQSVKNATNWVVFENNGSGLWNKVKMQVGGFMSNLFADGYFAGYSPEEAYFVVCDSSNNPQNSIDNGFLYVDVGIAVNKPAEFVVFRFSQKTLA